MITFDQFTHALALIESQDVPNAMGDSGRALGPWQMHPVLLHFADFLAAFSLSATALPRIGAEYGSETDGADDGFTLGMPALFNAAILTKSAVVHMTQTLRAMRQVASFYRALRTWFVMQANVICLRKQLKIFWSIIASVLVDVVNVFIGFQGTPDDILHHYSMFQAPIIQNHISMTPYRGHRVIVATSGCW